MNRVARLTYFGTQKTQFMSQELFKDFEGLSASAWKEKLIQDLKDKPYDSLLWKSNGLEGKPFYTAEDLDFELPQVANLPQDPSLFGDRFWVNYQSVVVSDSVAANKQALAALKNGANGIVFKLSESVNLKTLLKDVQVEYCHVSFQLDASVDAQALSEDFNELLKERGISSEQVNGFIHSANSFKNESPLRSHWVDLNTKGELPQNLANSLSVYIDWLDEQTEAGRDLMDCFDDSLFVVQTSNDFFLNIATLRAVRQLLNGLVQAYGEKEANLKILCQVGPWQAEIDDPHSFMLHATTQAMSVILGGTDQLHVLPFYEVFPQHKSLAERIARNISSILNEESHFNKMTDPAQGSYYIESLTHQICEKTMTLLKSIEDQGGYAQINSKKTKGTNA